MSAAVQVALAEGSGARAAGVTASDLDRALTGRMEKNGEAGARRARELAVRCVGGLLLLRAARGKWVPEYASAVLVALVDDISAGLGGGARRRLSTALMTALAAM